MRKGLRMRPYAALLGALAIALPQGAQAQMTIEQTIERNHAEADFAVPDFARPALAPSREEPAADMAEKLRKLDIMLMVTGLRCRTTADNFLEDFQAFEAAHMSELNAAARDLKTQIAAQEGKDAAERALDRIGVSMANQFGGGHPWLDCHALKELAHALAITQGTAVLRDAADLALGAGPRLAYRP